MVTRRQGHPKLKYTTTEKRKSYFRRKEK